MNKTTYSVIGRTLFKFITWALLTLSANVQAHDLNFGYLNITEMAHGDYQFLFRFTSKKLDLKQIQPKVPDSCNIYQYEKNALRDVERTIRWQASCHGKDIYTALPWIKIEGLPSDQHLIVRLKLIGEATKEQLVRSNPIALAPFKGKAAELATSPQASGFLFLGFEHILEGYDHLLVVLCFLLLFQNIRQLLFVITGFTVGHSVSLILVSFYSLKFPVSVVEILITLSVAFMARECFIKYANTDDQTTTLIQTYPVIMSTLIGLLHGMGFAAVLRDLGLPAENSVSALLMFNVGIELGQLLFAACGVTVLNLASRFIGYREYWAKLMSVGIGTCSVVWLIQMT